MRRKTSGLGEWYRKLSWLELDHNALSRLATGIREGLTFNQTLATPHRQVHQTVQTSLGEPTVPPTALDG